MAMAMPARATITDATVAVSSRFRRRAFSAMARAKSSSRAVSAPAYRPRPPPVAARPPPPPPPLGARPETRVNQLPQALLGRLPFREGRQQLLAFHHRPRPLCRHQVPADLPHDVPSLGPDA